MLTALTDRAEELAYTLLDDAARQVEDWLATIPAWVAGAVLAIIAFGFVYAIAKRILLLGLVTGILIAAMVAIWWYSAYLFH